MSAVMLLEEHPTDFMFTLSVLLQSNGQAGPIFNLIGDLEASASVLPKGTSSLTIDVVLVHLGEPPHVAAQLQQRST